MDALLIEAVDEGFSFNDVKRTMTVGDLVSYLTQFNGEEPVYISFNNAYTVGGVKKERIRRMPKL